MTRTSRILHIAYGALFVWLTYSAVTSGVHGAWWHTSAFIAGTALILTAVWREGLFQDALERDTAHVCPAPEPMPRPLSNRERAAFDEITAGFNDKDQAA